MEPAHSIIERLGGAAIVASITKTAYTAPYRWQHPRARRGSDGQIPARHIPTLLAYAKEHGIRLSADDFFVLRKEAAE